MKYTHRHKLTNIFLGPFQLSLLRVYLVATNCRKIQTLEQISPQEEFRLQLRIGLVVTPAMQKGLQDSLLRLIFVTSNKLIYFINKKIGNASLLLKKCIKFRLDRRNIN
ncbi:hypothetical protein WS93_27935 [Burkholderia cepacia]|nr:hypothetical protein WS93_27935 [Burkholderia cepacia]